MLLMYVYITLVSCLSHVCTNFTDVRGRQRSNILRGYDVNVRPSVQTNISVTLALASLKKLDIGSQTLSTNFYLELSWFDERLVWTPDAYYNDYFLFKINEVWTPSFVIDNYIEDHGLIGIYDDGPVPMRVSYNGTVIWVLRISTITICKAIITYYPYDTQTCNINITEWSYTSNEVNLVPGPTEYYPEKVYIGTYTEDGEWELMSRDVQELDVVGSYGLVYKNLQYTFEFKRRPAWYIPIVMIPLGLMSILMSGVFLVPVKSGEKMTYALTVMLSFTVTLSFISSTLPSVSDTYSLIGVYIAVVMVTSGLVVVLTAIVLYLHHKGESDKKYEELAKMIDRSCLIISLVFYACMMIIFSACFNVQWSAEATVWAGTILPFLLGILSTFIYYCVCKHYRRCTTPTNVVT